MTTKKPRIRRGFLGMVNSKALEHQILGLAANPKHRGTAIWASTF